MHIDDARFRDPLKLGISRPVEVLRGTSDCALLVVQTHQDVQFTDQIPRLQSLL